MAECIVEHNAKGWTLVWENPSPTSAFAAQTVELDLTNYSWAMLEIISGTGSNNYTAQYFSIPIEETKRLAVIKMNILNSSFHTSATTTTPNLLGRMIDNYDKTGISFKRGVYKAANNTNANTKSNNYCYPTRIWAR